MWPTPLAPIVFFLCDPGRKPGGCPHALPSLHLLILITHGGYRPKQLFDLATPFYSHNLCHLSPGLLFCLYKTSEFSLVKLGGVWSRRSPLNSAPESNMKESILVSFFSSGPQNSVLLPPLSPSYIEHDSFWIFFHVWEEGFQLFCRRAISHIFTKRDKIQSIKDLRQI